MTTTHTVTDLQSALSAERTSGARMTASPARIGFVPTMGALHDGHISLIQQALSACDITVASIFVNPTQFDDPHDLAAYPRDLHSDLGKLERAGCHLAFIPKVEEIYPPGVEIPVYEFGNLEQILEGAVRPGHFKGVGQVVARLLDIVQPDELFMGQKDYQQYLIVKKLVEEILKMKTQVVMCAIVREPDGLAMSSRNVRLTPQQRKDAVVLSRTLFWIKEQVGQETPEVIKQKARERLNAAASITAIDYIEIADAQTLDSLNARIGRPMVVLGAIRMGDVRLIDNVMVNKL